MAIDTPLELRNLNIYSLFTRNFSEAGTFKAVEAELDRIKNLGTDVIWFLPFYPIGEENRKGTIGSPYTIKDYRAIDTAHGSKENFQELIAAIHTRGMKVMIDIVFNHTAPDSTLVKEHPEWFFIKDDGAYGNKVGDWVDVIDLDYNNKELWDNQIDILIEWAERVDGFRCDVAPLVPIEFWKQARAAVDKVKPNFIWLAETNHRGFVQEARRENILAQSDAEMYQAFDLTYDYDVDDEFREYIVGNEPLSKYVHALNLQDSNFPANFVKLKLLENHDHLRFASMVDNLEDIKQWTAFYILQKGATLIYNGQEVLAKETPSLFEKEPIDWNTSHDLSDYIAHLSTIKKAHVPVQNDRYILLADDEMDTVTMTYMSEDVLRVGIFNLKQKKGKIRLDVPDGDYRNLISNQSVTVEDGEFALEQTPAYFITDFN